MRTRTWTTALPVLAAVLALGWAWPSGSAAAMTAVSRQNLLVADGRAGPAELTAEQPPDQPKAGSNEAQPPTDQPGEKERGSHRGDFDRSRHGFGEGFSGGPPEKMFDRAMEVLREKLPKLHGRLEKLKSKSPERFREAMHEIMPIVMEYFALLDRNPELAEKIFKELQIEEQLRHKSHEYLRAKGDPERQTELSTDIEKLVAEQLGIRQERQVARLEEFARRIGEQQKRLEEQKARLKEEMDQRDKLVAKRVAEIKEGKVGDSLKPIGPRPHGPDGEFRRHGQRGPAGPEGPGDTPPPPPDEGKPPPPPPGQPAGPQPDKPGEQDDEND